MDWSEISQRQYHLCRYDHMWGNWELPRSDGKLGHESRLYLRDILHLLTDSRLETIDLCDIAWNGKHHYPYNSGPNCLCCPPDKPTKYHTADPSCPGILLKNAPNPYNNKYRMVDGRHRIMKLLNQGKTSSQYYVLDFDEVKEYFLEKVFCPVEKKMVKRKADLS